MWLLVDRCGTSSDEGAFNGPNGRDCKPTCSIAFCWTASSLSWSRKRRSESPSTSSKGDEDKSFVSSALGSLMSI